MSTPGHAGLMPYGSRFPLSYPAYAPSGVTAVVPFGARAFKSTDAVSIRPPMPYCYCPKRQVAVDADGVPLVHAIEAWDRTTTGDQDGHKGPSEEFKLDYCGG